VTYIDDVFGPDGYLGQAYAGYVPREGQVEMARAVDQAILDRRPAMIEAPTGCHAAGQGILMFDGSLRFFENTKRVEDIVVGDLLAGPSREPRRVVELVRGEAELVDIVPDLARLRPWRVNLDHVLTLLRARTSRQQEDITANGDAATAWYVDTLKTLQRVQSYGCGDSVVDVTVRAWLEWPEALKRQFVLFQYNHPSAGWDFMQRHFFSFRVERHGETGRYYGFSLDGDGRYLLDDLTVTHNTGKSVAYMVPAIYHVTQRADELMAARSPSAENDGPPRALIVTANIALQSQLISSDVPRLQTVLPWEFTAAIAKGRQQYACLDRIEGTNAELERQPFRDAELTRLWTEIRRWSRETRTGDLSELPFELGRALKPRVSVSADDCLGKSCPNHGSCYSEKAKTAWHDANIMVTNYHLLFAHLTLGNVLPPFDIAILDECFVAGTMVGRVPIERVCVGDKVRSYNETTRSFVLATVCQVLSSRPSSLVRVRVEGDGDGDHDVVLVCTPWHPFLTERGWVPAFALRSPRHFKGYHQAKKMTDRVIRDRGDVSPGAEKRWFSSVLDVEVIEPTPDGTFGGACPGGVVYNLEIESTHTYLVENVVVHNCHEAADIAREFLGLRLTQGAVRYAGRLLAPSGARRAKTRLGVIDEDLQMGLNQAGSDFFMQVEEVFFQEPKKEDSPQSQNVVVDSDGVVDVRWDDRPAFAEPNAIDAVVRASENRLRIKGPKMVDPSNLTGLLRRTANLYDGAADEFRTKDDEKREEEGREGGSGPELDMLVNAAGRARKLADDIERVINLTESTKSVYFVEHAGDTKSVTLGSLPIEVGPHLQRLLFDSENFASVIATSATLSTVVPNGGGGRLDFFVRSVGAWRASRLIVSSPFDLKKQSRLVIPWNSPDPKDLRAFENGIGKLVVQSIEQSRGRTLGLFASKKRLDIVAELVREKLGSTYTILVQGEAPRQHLIRRFKEDESSVLLGTKSFWAGVDVPGRSLSCVVIDRLPFPPKDDPIVSWLEEAAARELLNPKRDPRARKINIFYDYMLPKAIIALRQGVGRLVRAKDDRGVVVILDRRLTDESKYGARVVDALGMGEPMQNINDIGDFLGRE